MAKLWEMVNNNIRVISNTPETLWANACEYFKWCDENPIEFRRTAMAGKYAGVKLDMEEVRPYSIKGLCLYCNVAEDYLKDLRNTKDKSSPYYTVVSKILYIIYVQNYEMAVIGVFNPVFTAKVLNMDDEGKTVAPVQVNIIGGLPSLSNSENEVLEKLELEKPFSDLVSEQEGV